MADTGKQAAAKIRETAEIAAILNDESTSKSVKIRSLFAITNDRSTVANLLGIRYQHVRNVLLTPLTTK